MAMTEVLFEKQPRKKKWWTTNRGLIIILLVLTCVCLGGYCYYITYHDQGDICTTRGCLKASLRFTSSIDESVDPCEDFYAFSCGKFIKEAYETNNPFPYLGQIQRRNNQLNGIIASPITSEEWPPQLLQKQFYQACMNESAIDDDQNWSLMRLIKEIGGWPVIEGHAWEDLELDTVLVKCREMGLPFEWFFTIVPKIWLDQIQIGIPKLSPQFNNDSFKRSVYLDLMVETAVDLGGSRLISRSDMEKALDFEMDLYQIMQKYAYLETSEKNYDELELMFANNDLSLLIEELIDDVFTFSDNTTMKVNEDFIREMGSLLARTPRRTYTNFFIWKIIQDFGVFLTTPIREHFGNVSNFMVDKKDQALTRSDICMKEAKMRFPNIAETSYTMKYSDNKTLETIKEMVSNIKNIFHDRINTADWISTTSKENAIEKLEHVVERIGDYRLYYDSDILETFLHIGNLNFTTDNIVDMAREKHINDFNLKFMVGNTTIDQTTKFILKSGTEINASFMDIYNVIVISAAISQDLFYSNDRPNYLNYGNLGIIIAHELSHGYDQFSFPYVTEEEILYPETWFNESTLSAIDPLWDKNTMDEIVVRSTCVTDQYEESTGEVSGPDVLTENFADLLGVDIAYEAYVAWAKIHAAEEKQLPGLPYNSKQMFWLAHATQFCYERVSTNDVYYTTGDHAPYRYRVMWPLRNSRNFPMDFKCAPGTNMNPVEKCFIF